MHLGRSGLEYTLLSRRAAIRPLTIEYASCVPGRKSTREKFEDSNQQSEGTAAENGAFLVAEGCADAGDGSIGGVLGASDRFLNALNQA
ncbi:MAG: hypothetical protein HY749_17325 [Gammaproteobacteria bacterium]|nr:hypothetical protein [Gammaproteobacteria bacterium]MBI5616417.1 hypothetical protein [Gammaproteobacteria bacterium]